MHNIEVPQVLICNNLSTSQGLSFLRILSGYLRLEPFFYLSKLGNVDYLKSQKRYNSSPEYYKLPLFRLRSCIALQTPSQPPLRFALRGKFQHCEWQWRQCQGYKAKKRVAPSQPQTGIQRWACQRYQSAAY